ncbi:MAG: ubiquitin-conjugating protein E2 [Candidatus Magnetoglobus multicellularis str. Araruama]|uniref:Ubiquitin-conjugating protein E2 n=1 Tax=Candidatus Magnetoglobus multicellularis str. Araruama TaxID=890399 RepID=A0A1V1NVP9_9BACT|nr:MAG: ubiquitin-conjugating protein E2 [Candidatus Magnetoglobus multicellularis str. Araruama]
MDKGQKGNRLNPTDTLHDAGVRPGDTLRVSPERTAGAINPMDRDAALARVRNEVLDFADAHTGFTVEANSPVAPTEYLFKFSTEGFAPSHFQDGTPRPIKDHEVLLVLPGDFPVQAPEVWWQTDIFHPNIDPKTGFVCLGELQDQYRPALNMGVLCQLLIDLAAYRNYAETDALDMDAARWALSDKGQKAIKDIKGQTIKSRDEKDDVPDQKLRIRKIKS